MKPVVIKWAKCVLLFICCIFIISGAVNNTNRTFKIPYCAAVPFLFLAIWLARGLSQKVQMVIAGVIVLLSWMIWPSEENSLIYPYVGEPVYLEGNFVSIRYTEEPYNYIYNLDNPRIL